MTDRPAAKSYSWAGKDVSSKPVYQMTEEEAQDALKAFKAGCIHYWIIETPSGESYSNGVCCLCRAEKQFKNSFDYDLDFVDAKTDRSGRGKGRPKGAKNRRSYASDDLWEQERVRHDAE